MVASEMSLRGRIGAYTLHARHDPRDTTAAARAAFLGRFALEVDPTMDLPPAERARRAESARRAYFARLALASAQARRPKMKKAEPHEPDLPEEPRNARATPTRSS